MFSLDTILNSGQSLLMNISERIGGMPFTMNSSEWEIKNISWQEVDIYYTNLIGQSVFFNFEVVHYNGTPKLFVRNNSYLLAKNPYENCTFDKTYHNNNMEFKVTIFSAG